MSTDDPAIADAARRAGAQVPFLRPQELAKDDTPHLPVVQLLEFLPPWLRYGRLPSGVHIAGPSVRLLRNHPWLARRLHDQGNEVYVWTVNTPPDVDLVLECAVEGIISDRPRYVLDRLGR